MSDDLDKPRIVIPPSINIGEHDIQLSFHSVGDGMCFELEAKEGDGPDADEWSLLRFYPGKGFFLPGGAVLQTTSDFPVDSEGRMQLIDGEMKKLLEVYPEQVKGEDAPTLDGHIKFKDLEWWLELGKEGVILRVMSKSGGKLGVLTITESGIKRWKGVPESATGIPTEGDHDTMKVLEATF